MRARVPPIIASRLSALISIKAPHPRRIAANIAKLPEMPRKP